MRREDSTGEARRQTWADTMKRMATINVQQSTFEAIQGIAESEGSDVNATIEKALAEFIAARHMGDAAFQQRWDKVLADIRSHIPEELTPDEIESDIDAAVNEVRAERLARGN